MFCCGPTYFIYEFGHLFAFPKKVWENARKRVQVYMELMMFRELSFFTLLETAADGLKNYVNAFFELIISRDLNLVEINISLIL